MQLYKYAVQMVTHSFGKTATFMPKPVKGDNGSGMHCHQSIWKGSTPVFMGKEYAGFIQRGIILYWWNFKTRKSYKCVFKRYYEQL